MKSSLSLAAVGVVALAMLVGCPERQPATVSTKSVPAAGTAAPAAKEATTKETTSSSESAADNSHGTAADGYSKQPQRTPEQIAAEQPIFVGWEKPKWALVITGQQLGYLEPCGCAGLENQKGGLSRRHTFFKQLRDKEWPLVAVDVGGLMRRYGLQEELKFQAAVDGLRTIGYDAVSLGVEDLRLSTAALFAGTSDEDGPFVSANVGLFEMGNPPPFKIVEIAGVRVGITAVLGDEQQKSINNDEVILKPAREALAEQVPLLLEQSDYQVLLSYATPKESAALAKEFPDFDVVVTAEGAEEPPHEASVVAGTQTQIVECGQKGMYAIVLGMYDDAEQPLRYQRVPLDRRFEDSPEMKQLMATYQDQLRSVGFAGLELRPGIHPRGTMSGDPLGQFVGAQKCGECHKEAMSIWSKSKHAHATETLVNLNPPRQFDPECLSCHATGWNPQEYTPYESGFMGMDVTAHLQGNSCENCHGPGGAHVAAEADRKKLGVRDEMRAMMRLTKATAEDRICKNCHDHDNSPEFDFAKYWPKVEHKGKK